MSLPDFFSNDDGQQGEGSRDDAAATMIMKYEPKLIGVPRTLAKVACGAVLVLLVFQIFVSDTRYVDFRYIWFAGKLWGEGINPYSPLYAARAASDFPEWDFPLFLWIYPPCWYPLSIAFAQFPVGFAHRVGSVIALLATIAGSWTIWRRSQIRGGA